MRKPRSDTTSRVSVITRYLHIYTVVNLVRNHLCIVVNLLIKTSTLYIGCSIITVTKNFALYLINKQKTN